MRWAETVGMIIAGLLLASGACAQNMPETPEKRVQAVLDSLRAAVGFPGATAAIVTPDGTRYAMSTGFADRADSTHMTPETRMLGGSTGKSFAAAVALDLVQQGQLDLDAPIARWLSDRPWFDRLPNAEAITLRMLLRHQSGLVDHIHDPDFAEVIQHKMEAEGPGAVLAPEDLIRFVLDVDPLFPAGAGYHYSDTNYILAGLIVEAVTDSAYYNVLQQRILDPLGLTLTGPADQRKLSGLATGYIEGEAPFNLPPTVTQGGALVYNPETEWTGGGLVTNPQDLARWAKALYEGEALSGDYLDALLDAVPKDSTQQVRFGGGVQYGLGVTIRTTSLGPAYGHRGWTPGYLSIFEYYPEHGIAVALQVNALGPYELTDYVLRLARATHDAVHG